MRMTSTSIDYLAMLTPDGLTFYDQNVAGTTITLSSVTSGSFIKSGGTSAQFLKADGSVDSNTYLTSASLADYLPLTGGTLSGNLTVLNSYLSVVAASSSSTPYTTTITSSAVELRMRMTSTSIDYLAMLTPDGLTFYDQNVAGTTITLSSVTSGSFIKSGGTSSQFLKADGSVDSTAYLPKQGSSFYFITDADMPETAANISTLNAAHRMTLYRNAILMPYMANDANDGGFIRSRGTSESSAIMEIGMWDDSGAGETIQFNYYPTTSTINPTYTVTVPKKSGTIALTSDLSGYLPLTGGTITGNLTVNGNNGINFGTDDDVYIKREYSRLLIINEAGNDIIIGDYDNRKFTSIVNDLQGGTTDSTYRSVTQKWLIRHDGDAYFKSVSQTSDLRKKTIMGDVPMNLYNVANAPLFKFTWNNEKKYSGQHIGSAAQYWQTVLPELVSIGRDADMTLAMQYDVIALASAITVAKTVVNHEERIILLERENEALKKEIADLKSA